VLTRRDLLRAAGATTAAALLGCGARARPLVTARAGEAEALRGALRDAVEILATRLREPVAYALVRRRVRAVVDLAQRDVTDATTIAIVVGGRDGAGAWRERAIDRAEPARVRAAAQALVAEAPPGTSTPLAFGAPIDHATALDVEPAGLATGDWLAQAEVVAQRAEATASSRIIYRAAYLTCDDDRSWIVSADADVSQRLVRTRVGATAVAWQGSAPIAGTAEVAGGFGPAHERLGDDALAAMTAEALSLHAASEIATSPSADVVLAPAVIAAIVDAGWAGLGRGGLAVVTDDPALANGFGSYFVDDLGAAAAPIVLGGAPMIAGRARRSQPSWRLATGPSNLVMTLGASDPAALEGQVEDGFVVDGVANLQRDRAGAIALRATRARRIVRGARTGESWRDVELRGDAAAIVTAIRAIGNRAETIAPLDDDRPARAIVVPAVLTRAAIAPARGDW